MKCQKVKFKVNRSKNWVKSIKYVNCISSQLYFLSLLKSYQLEVQDPKKINVYVFLKKSDSKERKTTTWSAEKLNVEQIIIKIGQSGSCTSSR